MVNVEVSYKGFPIANIPEGQTGRLACRGKKMVSDVTIAYKSTGVNKLAQIVDKTITELTADDLKGATAIGRNAFDACSKLANITIPNSVTSLGQGAFKVCSKLASVTIPNSVTSIEQGAFDGCESLPRITIPNVTTFGAWVFQNCKKLEVVDFSQAKVVPTIPHTDVFLRVPNTCKIVVPDALYDSWITATNWSAITLTFVKASEYTGG